MPSQKLDAELQGNMLPAGRFFGAASSATVVPGFQLAELVYAPSIVLPKHAHAQANFCFVLEGSYEEACERSSCQHSVGSVVFHPAEHWHSDRHAPTTVRLLSVELSATRLEIVAGQIDALRYPCTLANSLVAHLCWRLYEEVHRPDDVSGLAMEGLILEILAALSRGAAHAKEAAHPRWLRQAEDLLRSRCLGTINLAQLAGEIGVHPVHLARTFRAVHRCSPGEYMRRLRVEAACFQLKTTARPLCEVARSTGFADQSHLTRTFRQHLGVTPREFRRQFAG